MDACQLLIFFFLPSSITMASSGKWTKQVQRSCWIPQPFRTIGLHFQPMIGCLARALTCPKISFADLKIPVLHKAESLALHIEGFEPSQCLRLLRKTNRSSYTSAKHCAASP